MKITESYIKAVIEHKKQKCNYEFYLNSSKTKDYIAVEYALSEMKCRSMKIDLKKIKEFALLFRKAMEDKI